MIIDIHVGRAADKSQYIIKEDLLNSSVELLLLVMLGMFLVLAQLNYFSK